MALHWVNVTAVDDTSEVEMDAHAGPDASETARFRHRAVAMTRWGQHSRELGMVDESWTPGLPVGHRWKKKPKCSRCKDTGWLDPIGPKADDSYITSRPCACDAGKAT